MKVGYHFSISGYSGKQLVDLFKEISEHYPTGQFFISSPQQMQNKDISKRLTKAQLKKINALFKKNKFKLYIHCNYLVNLARSPAENVQPLKILTEELISGEKLGAKGVVIHVGKTKQQMSNVRGIANMIENIVTVLKKIEKMRVQLLLESSAGVGSEIGRTITEFSKVVHGVIKRIKGTASENNFGVCLDTAHLHSSGIDLRSKNAAKQFVKDFQQKIGWNHVKLIHFNDSEREMGSRVDRHGTVGMGYITLTSNDGMKLIAQVAQKLKIPLILERSDKIHSELAGELKLIESWAR